MAAKTKTTKGGRILMVSYSVQRANGRWVVGCGSWWVGKKMTLFEARAEAKRRNGG